MIRRTLACALIVTTTFTGLSGAAMSSSIGYEPESSETRSSESIDAELEEIILQIEEARGFVDRSQFDSQVLLDSLDFDVERIEQFVNEQIAFEQYPGILRGVQGTLMGRAGNALDQSVLLASLIKDAGFEAEIVRSNLSRGQARALLEQMSKQTPASPPPGDLEAIAALLEGDASSIPSASANPPLPSTAEQETEQAAKFLLDTIESHGQQLGSPDSEMSLIEEARDYFWVRHRDGPSSNWAAAHPAFGNSDVEALRLEAVATYRASIPSELHHRFRLEIFLEQKFGDQLKVHSLIPAWERPVANMLGRSFTISNYPNGLGEATVLAELGSQLRKSEVFVPVLNGEVIPGTQGFDLDGTLYDLGAQGADTFGATPLFRELGRGLDRATGSLGTVGGTEPSVGPLRALSAQWIEYSLIAPDGETRRFRRYLFDRLGDEERREKNVGALPADLAEWWGPIASQEVLLAGARYPEALILDEFLARLAAHAQLVRRFLATRELNFNDFAEESNEGRGANALVLLALLDKMELPDGVDPASTYRSEPTLLAIHQEMTAEDQVSFGTDIISNQRRSRRFAAVSSAALDVMMQGIWETYTERLLFDLLDISPLNFSSAFDLLGEHQVASSHATLLEHRDDLETSVIDISSPLQRDLESGYLAVLPEVDHYRSVGWWRIDPYSGATVGSTPDGRGATTGEYLIVLTAIPVILIGGLSIVSAVECEAKIKKQIEVSGGRAPQTLPCCVIQENAKTLREILAGRLLRAEYKLRTMEAYGARNCE